MDLKITYVPRSRFIGRRWYLWPSRITLKAPDRPRVYRWLCWNFGWWPSED